MRRVGGWLLFGFGILYLIVAPIIAKMYMSAGQTVFGGMSLQIGIGIAIIAAGWGVAHSAKRQK